MAGAGKVNLHFSLFPLRRTVVSFYNLHFHLLHFTINHFDQFIHSQIRVSLSLCLCSIYL